jgi:hypothetical protein
MPQKMGEIFHCERNEDDARAFLPPPSRPIRINPEGHCEANGPSGSCLWDRVGRDDVAQRNIPSRPDEESTPPRV